MTFVEIARFIDELLGGADITRVILNDNVSETLILAKIS
jgi:hypothetical protein